MTEAHLLQVWINQTPYQLTAPATLADAVALVSIQPPFAAAVNLNFVPKTRYEQHALSDGDHIELIAPITGG
jgi:sulfur carrier protein